jgi:hypothetical protein
MAGAASLSVSGALAPSKFCGFFRLRLRNTASRLYCISHWYKPTNNLETVLYNILASNEALKTRKKIREIPLNFRCVANFLEIFVTQGNDGATGNYYDSGGNKLHTLST